MKIKQTVYVHTGKWSVYEELEDQHAEITNSMSEDAIHNLKYALNEIKVDLEIDTETGGYIVLSMGES
jgi:hypothetical protein